MDYITKGIVLKTVNYKEADKIASIFTLDEGIISAKFAGVRREKAKLKAMSQPFSFCEFNVNKTATHRTITNATVIDLFANLTMDYTRTMCGYIVLDIVRSILIEEKPEREIFLATITALKNIETASPLISTIDFILQFMLYSGVGLQFVDSPYIYLSRNTGEFSTIRDENCYEVDKLVYSTLKAINDDEPFTANEQTLKQILKMLHNILFAKFNVDIKSFEFI